MTTDTKPTNPKDIIGQKKVPIGLAPDTAIAEMSLAFLEGALKYGRYNWRIAGVRASVYNDALERHRKKWWNGQDRDPVTRVRELASVMACAAILIDAELCGKLTDDRPPRGPVAEQLDSPEMLALVAHLKELFKDHEPHQYTIADSAPVERQFAFELLDDDQAPTIGWPSAVVDHDTQAPRTLVEAIALGMVQKIDREITGDHDEATALARLHERVRATEDSANGR